MSEIAKEKVEIERDRYGLAGQLKLDLGPLLDVLIDALAAEATSSVEKFVTEKKEYILNSAINQVSNSLSYKVEQVIVEKAVAQIVNRITDEKFKALFMEYLINSQRRV